MNKNRLIELHRPSWHGVRVLTACFLAVAGLEAALLWTLLEGAWWQSALLIVLVAHLMHLHVIAFHEAAHGSLCPIRPVNDALGLFIGTLSFMSLSLYRSVHHLHHAFLSTQRDEELWPFVNPGTPLWTRRLAACCELFLGLFYTPFLFLRAFLRPGTEVKNRTVRNRIWLELGLDFLAWASLLAGAAWFDVWRFYLCMFLAPALLAGFMQTFRKYVEHMGLLGSTVLGCTRSVVNSGPLGRLVALSMFNEPFHGIHHIYAKVPQALLPEMTSLLIPESPEEMAPFPTYRQAIWDMFSSLGNPRIGAQWLVRENEHRATREFRFQVSPRARAYREPLRVDA